MTTDQTLPALQSAMRFADEYAFMAKTLADSKIIGPAVAGATHPASIARAKLESAIAIRDATIAELREAGGIMAALALQRAVEISDLRTQLAAMTAERDAALDDAKRLGGFADLWYFVMDDAPMQFERIVTEYSSSAWMREAAKLRAATGEG